LTCNQHSGGTEMAVASVIAVQLMSITAVENWCIETVELP